MSGYLSRPSPPCVMGAILIIAWLGLTACSESSPSDDIHILEVSSLPAFWETQLLNEGRMIIDESDCAAFQLEEDEDVVGLLFPPGSEASRVDGVASVRLPDGMVVREGDLLSGSALVPPEEVEDVLPEGSPCPSFELYTGPGEHWPP